MTNQPKFIFEIGEPGKLTMSFTGPAVKGADKLDLSDHSPEALIPQIRELDSETGFIQAEFPGESTVRNIQVWAKQAIA